MLRLLVVWLREAWLQGLTSSLESSDMEVRGAGPQGWQCNSLGLSCSHRRHTASLQERKWLFISFICQQFAVTTHHSPWKCFWLATTWEDEVVRLIKPAGDLRQGKPPCVWLTLPLPGLCSFPPLFSFLLFNPLSVFPALSCLPCDVFPNKAHFVPPPNAHAGLCHAISQCFVFWNKYKEILGFLLLFLLFPLSSLLS